MKRSALSAVSTVKIALGRISASNARHHSCCRKVNVSSVLLGHTTTKLNVTNVAITASDAQRKSVQNVNLAIELT